MLTNNELQQRLAKEYSYAVAKMQEATQPAQKLYYFSVFFGEVQRILNSEWNRDLVIIHSVTSYVYKQISTALADPSQGIPRDWKNVFEAFTKASAELAAYVLKNEDNKEELLRILERFAEIAYGVSGNGSYLIEKGAFRL